MMSRYLNRSRSILTLFALFSAPAFAQPMVTLAAHEKDLDILIDGQRVAQYVWQDNELPRPYFRQLTSPDGIQVSRNYPPDPVADKDNDDHPLFHPGAWLAFGDAAGADFWRNQGRVRHITFLAPPRTGKGVGTFTVINAYESTGENAKTLFMETCAYTIQTAKDGYIILSESEFKPEGEAFNFGDQEEMGLGVRLATPLSVKHGNGNIRNSAGGEQEAGTWGKAADWCAGYGKVGNRWAGMNVMASPDNFRQSWFHSRDYGLIVANPFGKKAMTSPKDDSVKLDKTPVAIDKTLKVGFGVYVFSVPGGSEPDLAAMFDTYSKARH